MENQKKLIRLAVKKIKLSNIAFDNLDSQFDRGLITKDEYKEYLKFIYLLTYPK